MSGSTYDTYYHHTDRESAKKIIESGKILQSDPKNGDAVYGKGTYVTKQGPDKSREAIAQNNYDGVKAFSSQKIREGKTDVALEINVKASKIEPCNTSGRDVHKYPGDLSFESSDVKSVKVHVRDDKGYKTYTSK